MTLRSLAEDAAVITVANQVMSEPAAWMSVDSFISTYADSKEARLKLTTTLFLFNLIQQRYEKGQWDLEGQYYRYWSNELS
jgi:hypothetical protein